MVPFLKILFLILAAHVTQRPLRTLLTITGVALGVSASVAVRTANVDVLHSFEQTVLTVAGPTTLEISGGEVGLDERLITAVRNVPGVMAASPVILQTAVKPGDGAASRAIQVLGLDLLAEIDSRGFRVGHQPQERRWETLLDSNALLLGRKQATEWHVSVGDTVDLLVGPGRVTCRISGILEDAADRTSSWDRLAVMDIAAAQVTFDMVGRLDRIDLLTEEGRSVEDIAHAVRAIMPPHIIVERPTSRTNQVEQMLRAFRLNLTVLSWVGLLVGMFLIYNTMAFAVAQRRREIGVYRAIGMTQTRVAILFLVEAGVLGLVGGALGSATGFVLARQLTGLLSRTISDLYIPVGSEGGDGLASGWFLTLSLEGLAVGCLVSMVGAIGPSLDAGRTAPAATWCCPGTGWCTPPPSPGC